MNIQPASTTKRLLAIVYDSLLLIAILFLAMAVMSLILKGENQKDGNLVATIYLILVSYGFFAWFWIHGGQTLGMRAWKLQLVSTEKSPINYKQAAIRFSTAMPAWVIILIGIAEVAGIPLVSQGWLAYITQLPNGIILGFGLLLLWFDQRPDNWRDRLSHSRIIQLDKNPRKDTG
jgi:uncharacterized RDD family membrane protein YckC